MRPIVSGFLVFGLFGIGIGHAAADPPIILKIISGKILVNDGHGFAPMSGV